MNTMERTRTRRSDWRRLLVGAAVISLVVVALTAALRRDVEAAAYTVLVALGLAGLRLRKGTAGVVALGLLHLNALAWMAPAAWSNIRHGESFTATLVPVVLSVAGATAFVAAVGTFAERRGGRPAGSHARTVALVAAVSLVVAMGASFVSSGGVAGGPPDIDLVTSSGRFSESSVHTEAGPITVRLKNEDLFWHTFTVRELDVDLRVPVSARRSVTFSAPPGTYRFVCAIPGHEQGGMEGTLTIR